MSNIKKTTNPKTKKSVRVSTKATPAKTVKSVKKPKAPKRSTINAKQIEAHHRHLARISGILLCLGAIAFIVCFTLFWIFAHTCDFTNGHTLGAVEIIFALPLLINILSLICALDCKHPLHSKTVILNIITIAIETIFLVFIPLYVFILR